MSEAAKLNIVVRITNSLVTEMDGNYSSCVTEPVLTNYFVYVRFRR